MTEAEVIQKIHNEFDNAVDVLNDISQSFIEKSQGLNPSESTTEDELGEFLDKIGFSNVDLAQQYKDTTSKNKRILSEREKLSKKAKHINAAIQEANVKFPGKKFILYTQVIQILEKYNLMLAPAKLYSGSIPKKNILEVKDFDDHIVKNIISCVSSDFEPLCANNLGYDSKASYYICAPDGDFIKKGAHRIQRELFWNPTLNKLSWSDAMTRINTHKKVKDPIILIPVRTDLKQPGFIVVSKWGLESDEKLLKN